MEVGSGPCNKVFGDIDQLWVSLKNAVRNGEKISRENVCSILDLERENPLGGGSFGGRMGNWLDTLVDAVTCPSKRIHEVIPPFSLQIEEEFFREENHGSLSRFFEVCGEVLEELELTLPLKKVSFLWIVRIPSIPVLRKLKVNFPHEMVCAASSNLSSLLHTILEKATAMTDFEVTFSHRLPNGFQNIYLPPSLTSIKLACLLRTHQLTIIKGNKLPNLSHLELMVPQQSLQTEQLFQALESVRTTLKSLSILGMAFTGYTGKVTYLRLPVMEELEKLEITSMNCELEPDASKLKQKLPKLTELTLTNQTLPMFQKWVGSFVSTTVTSVDIHVVTVSSSLKDLTLFTLDQHEMSALHRSFPNITSLSISVDPAENTGLYYVFQKMTKLTELTLEVVPGSSGLGADFWDGLLIGLEPEKVKMLRARPGTWVQAKTTLAGTISLRNLKNLESLCLWETPSSESPSSRKPEPLITDISYFFSFDEMTNLKALHFRGGFKLPEYAMSRWTEKSRTIICE